MATLIKPFFIGGSGRSGTSLLYSLIESNDACYGFSSRETKFIITANGLIDLYYALGENYSEARAKTAIKQFYNLMKRLKTGDIFYEKQGLDFFLKGKKLYDEIVNEFIGKLKTKSGIPIYRSGKELKLLIREFLSNLCINIKGYHPNKHFVEKTPHNLLHLNFLNELFPDLKFIHITRDPRGVAHSLTKQSWAPDDFEQACIWLLQVYEAFTGQKGFFEHTKINNFLHVKLEDLANENYKQISNEISSFLNLKKFKLTKESADEAKINYWEDILTPQQYEIANFTLGKFIKYFGYTIR